MTEGPLSPMLTGAASEDSDLKTKPRIPGVFNTQKISNWKMIFFRSLLASSPSVAFKTNKQTKTKRQTDKQTS